MRRGRRRRRSYIGHGRTRGRAIRRRSNYIGQRENCWKGERVDTITLYMGELGGRGKGVEVEEFDIGILGDGEDRVETV